MPYLLSSTSYIQISPPNRLLAHKKDAPSKYSNFSSINLHSKILHSYSIDKMDLYSFICSIHIIYHSKSKLFMIKFLSVLLTSYYLSKMSHKHNYLHALIKIIKVENYTQMKEGIDVGADRYNLKIE